MIKFYSILKVFGTDKQLYTSKGWAFLLVYNRNICLKLYVMCGPYTGWSKSLCAPDDYNKESYK
jgi:hypothetical protein